MTTAILAARLIQLAEGCRLTAYWDKNGKRWTIGFGHTRTARQGMVITQDQADELFTQDCAPLLVMVAAKPMIEAAALVSFGFNCGAGALARLLDNVITLDTYGRTSGGVQEPGLAARRDLEAALVEASRQVAKVAA